MQQVAATRADGRRKLSACRLTTKSTVCVRAVLPATPHVTPGVSYACALYRQQRLTSRPAFRMRPRCTASNASRHARRLACVSTAFASVPCSGAACPHDCAPAWLHGRLCGGAAWPHGHTAPRGTWLHGCMAAWSHGCMAACVVGLHGCMVTWLHGRLVTWLKTKKNSSDSGENHRGRPSPETHRRYSLQSVPPNQRCDSAP